MENKEVIRHILLKLSSGRWILTIIGGLVFAYAVYAKILPPEATASILTMVFVNYFQRDRKKEEQ